MRRVAYLGGTAAGRPSTRASVRSPARGRRADGTMRTMASRADLFRVLGDPNRLRILALLGREELAVSELQEVLGLGQSTVSGHLAQLRRAGLVATRREGMHTRSVVAIPAGEEDLVRLATSESLSPADTAALARVLGAREAPAPEGLGPDYLPGRSWEAFAHLLLALVPPLRIADLGVGTGRLTELLASRARRCIAIDRDPAALAALRPPIERREGRLEDPPLAPGEVDLVVLSQSLHCVADPLATLRKCHAALAEGGRIAVLDLAPHEHAWVRHRLGHQHLGFPDLPALLAEAGFTDVRCDVVHRDRKAPAFTTLLATGSK
jgi:ArsR family transcriptional regulator